MNSRFVAASVFLLLTCSAFAADPCQDVALVELRTRSLSSMSESEKEYFFSKEKLCTELQSRSLQAQVPTEVPTASKPSTPAKKTSTKVGTVDSGVTIGGVGGFLAGMAALILVLRIVAD